MAPKRTQGRPLTERQRTLAYPLSWTKRALLCVLAVGLIFVSVRYFPAPFVFAGLVALALVGILAISYRGAARFVFVNLGVAVFALTAIEGFFVLRQEPTLPTRFAGDYPKNYSQEDPDLGYGPRLEVQVPCTRYVGDTVVYDVIYSIDANGLRVAPTADESHLEGSVLFFGGSFTFGAGLNDEETLPFQVGVQTGGRYRVYNFGFHGYGPHQMLRALETGRVVKIVESKGQIVAIYQAVEDHARRAAGLAAWDQSGPRYILDGDDVVCVGPFSKTALLPGKLTKSLQKSHVYRKSLGYERALRAHDLKRYVKIVTTAQERFQDQFPGGRFVIILWPEKTPRFHDEILARFKERDFEVHLIVDILPDYRERKSQYKIPQDGHPNALCQSKIAAYVVEKILPARQP